MKKLIAGLMAVLLLSTVAVGCSNKNNENNNDGNAVVELKDGATLKDIVAKVDGEIGIQMGQDIDDTMLKDLIGVNKDDVEDYAGKFAMVMTSSDNFIAVKAKEGKVDAVKTALEARKETVVKSFEQYLPDQSVKAKSGKVIVKGNYVFLVIIGDTAVEDGKEFDTAAADAIVKQTEDIINGFFK